MQACPQTETQNVYQHGISVRDYLFDLIQYLKIGEATKQWRLPNWIDQYKEQLLQALLPWEILENYTIYHDCGKPFCRTIDENGKQHFPNHSEISAQTWKKFGGSDQEAELMRLDMDIHQLKADGIIEFAKRPEAITLLLTALSEVHSNAMMFGGLDSVSFKIKWKQIDKRGRAICQLLFKND